MTQQGQRSRSSLSNQQQQVMTAECHGGGKKWIIIIELCNVATATDFMNNLLQITHELSGWRHLGLRFVSFILSSVHAESLIPPSPHLSLHFLFRTL